MTQQTTPTTPETGGQIQHGRSGALKPFEVEPGTLVHASADRQLAVEQWLLATHKSATQVRREWQEAGIALLPLGTLMSAVRIPQRMVAAIAGTDDPGILDALLSKALGGPVICDPAGHRYYILVPGTMPDRWRHLAEDWRALGVDCLGRDTYIGVPKVQAREFDPKTFALYWSVSMPSAGELCAPLAVARLIAAAQCRLAGEAGA